MATPFRLGVDIGLPVCHAQGPREVQLVRVCGVPPRDWRCPPLQSVRDARPARVAYRAVLSQYHDKWEQDDNGRFSVAFMFVVTICTALPGSLEVLEKKKGYRSTDEMQRGSIDGSCVHHVGWDRVWGEYMGGFCWSPLDTAHHAGWGPITVCGITR